MKTVTVITILLFLFSRSTHAETINVVTEYLEPYQIKQENNSLGGFSTEVINALFRITGDKANIKVMPWARAYQTSLTQKNTLIFSIAHLKSRDQHFHWVGKIIKEELFFWGLKTNFTHSVENIDSFKSKKVAVSRSSNADLFLKSKQFVNIHPMTNDEQIIKMLFAQRVDLIIGTPLTLKTISTKLQLNFTEMVKLNYIPELNNDLSIAFNINSDKGLVKRYQQAYQVLIKSGELSKIQQKWLDTNIDYSEPTKAHNH